jgi:RNA polymerase sigma-70 factor, ECF subfamily
MNQFEEQQIVSAVLGGDVDAYAMLVNRYQQPILDMICRMRGSPEDAGDLARDAFIKAYEQLYRFWEVNKFSPGCTSLP